MDDDDKDPRKSYSYDIFSGLDDMLASGPRDYSEQKEWRTSDLGARPHMPMAVGHDLLAMSHPPPLSEFTPNDDREKHWSLFTWRNPFLPAAILFTTYSLIRGGEGTHHLNNRVLGTIGILFAVFYGVMSKDQAETARLARKTAAYDKLCREKFKRNTAADEEIKRKARIAFKEQGYSN